MSASPHEQDTQPESIDWSQVPSTVAEYEEMIGPGPHARLGDDDSRRTNYNFGFNELPRHLLPPPTIKEFKLQRKLVNLIWSENERHKAKFGRLAAPILDEIEEATYDGKISLENVFGAPPTEVWTKESGSTTLTRQEIITQPPLVREEDSKTFWYRHKNFLAIAGFSASVGLMSVMMLPIFPAPPETGPQSDPPVTDTKR